jgi:hypothetical protein
MRPGSFIFSAEWLAKVKSLPETGMGYTVVCVTLRDGRKFNQALIDSGYLTQVRGLPNVPFKEDDIAGISATHEKWDWNETAS